MVFIIQSKIVSMIFIFGNNNTMVSTNWKQQHNGLHSKQRQPHEFLFIRDSWEVTFIVHDLI